MNKIKIIALALSTAIFTGCTAGCSKNNVSDKNKSSDKISSDTNDPTETPSHAAGELITPPEDSEEYDLGSYRISDSGIKLYYEDSEYPAELMTALEKYFTSFQTCPRSRRQKDRPAGSETHQRRLPQSVPR